MAMETRQQLCEDCANRESCDYIPSGGRLIRCLDRQTTEAERRASSEKPGGRPEFERAV